MKAIFTKSAVYLRGLMANSISKHRRNTANSSLFPVNSGTCRDNTLVGPCGAGGAASPSILSIQWVQFKVNAWGRVVQVYFNVGSGQREISLDLDRAVRGDWASRWCD